MKGIDFKKQVAINTANTLKNNKLISSENVKKNLLVLPELKEFIPSLSAEEYKSLEDSIIANGCRTPLLVWDTTQGVINPSHPTPSEPAFVLFDGHHRYEICQKNRVDFQIDLMTFPSIDEVKDFMIDFQVGRRNMTVEQLSYFRGLKYQRMKNRQGGLRGTYTDIVDTASVLAEEFKVSPATIKRDAVFAQGIDKMQGTLKQQVLEGSKKIEKKLIQQLAKATVEKTVESLEELQAVVSNKFQEIAQTNSIKQTEALKKVSASMKKSNVAHLSLIVRGSFILENGLEAEWRYLRELGEGVIIEPDFQDEISFPEAIALGLIKL